MKTTDPPIILTETYDAPAARVWRAITDPAEMRQWFIEAIPDFQPVVGFETKFMVAHEGKTFPHHWTVTDVEEGERLVYEWRIEGYPGRSSSLWELSEEGAGAKLTLTCHVHEDFPQDVPEFRRESGVAGWTAFLKDALKRHLEDGA